MYIPEFDRTTKSIQLFLTLDEISQLYNDLERMLNEPVENDHTHFENETHQILIAEYKEQGDNQFVERIQKVIKEDL
jgi:hypothetical protein